MVAPLIALGPGPIYLGVKVRVAAKSERGLFTALEVGEE